MGIVTVTRNLFGFRWVRRSTSFENMTFSDLSTLRAEDVLFAELNLTSPVELHSGEVDSFAGNAYLSCSRKGVWSSGSSYDTR